MGYIRAICTSEKKGTFKTAVDEAELVENYGIKGDAHAGTLHRQVSLLSAEAVEEFINFISTPRKTRDKTDNVVSDCRDSLIDADTQIIPGCFGENLLVEGLKLQSMRCGDRLKAGNAILEITQRGKECHSGCEIRKLTGDCIMPRQGVFAKVISGSVIHPGDEINIIPRDQKKTYRAAVITASDRSWTKEREDRSGPLLAQILNEQGYEVIETLLLPDEKESIKKNLIRLSDNLDADLIITTGGTGMSERDVTPEATLEAATRNVPGIAEAMRAASMQITPHAMLSRGISVMRNHTLIINMPGSPKAVKECFDVIKEALPHGLAILSGDGDD
ncbi:MAG: MOSC domain-containing protein [Lachnospiraceae bacterium]|nr:MOSC domain-containing protein [Lachnospiraceae bacterium]